MFSPISHRAFRLAFVYLNSYLGSFNGEWCMQPCLPQSLTTLSCVMLENAQQASSSITAFSFVQLIHKC